MITINNTTISLIKTASGWAVVVDNGLTKLTHHFTCYASAWGRYQREIFNA
jgi:hypothetical protein